MKRVSKMAGGFVAIAMIGCGPSLSSSSDAPPGDPINSVEANELFRRGVMMARRGDFIRAEQYLSAAAVRGVPQEQVLPLLLRVCVAGSRLRMALSYAEPYLENHPEDWSLRYFVASIQQALGETAKAATSLRRVIAAAPAEPAPHYLLGVILAPDDGPTARGHLQRYLELAPSGPRANAATEALLRLDPSTESASTSPIVPAEDAPAIGHAPNTESEADP